MAGPVQGPAHELRDSRLTVRRARVRVWLGERVVLWTPDRLADVLADAVLDAGWPSEAVVPALLTVAVDPATGSPARLSCPGPWWDAPAPTPTDAEPDLDGDEFTRAGGGADGGCERQAWEFEGTDRCLDCRTVPGLGRGQAMTWGDQRVTVK